MSIPPIRVRFEQETGKGFDQVFTKPFRIGRDDNCEVCVSSSYVSRTHAEVVFEDGHWWMRDLGSTNGIYVGEKKLKQILLENRIILQLGWEGPLLHITIEGAGSKPSTPVEEETKGDLFEQTWPDPTPTRQKPPPSESSSWAPISSHLEPPVASPKISIPKPEEKSKSPQRPEQRSEEGRAEIEAMTVSGSGEDIGFQDLDDEQPHILRADRFMMPLDEDWQDTTTYIITGPVTDGIRHNITIDVDREPELDSLLAYVELQVFSLEQELNNCHLLLKEPITLDTGLPAYRVIFGWYPTEEQYLYQEQVYVLHEGTGYKLTATFTKKTRKMLGAEVEQIMLSFDPVR